MAATCPRARQYDRDHAERLIDLTAQYLLEAGLAGSQSAGDQGAPQDHCPVCRGGSYEAVPGADDRYLVTCATCGCRWTEPIQG
jgi:hypothetical protein